MNKDVLILTGPTAVGKTELSLQLAEDLNGEIISADSVQLYKGMNIGSATPTDDELSRVPHHMINEIDPLEDFNVAMFAKRAKKIIHKLHEQDKLPIIAGGTGLYINALLYEMDFSEQVKDEHLRKELRNFCDENGKEALHEKLATYDPEAAKKIHKNNVKRVIRALEINILTGENMGDFKKDPVKVKDYNPILVCLKRNRKLLYVRINRRVDMMLEAGLIDEVKSLREKGLTMDHTAMKAIGYKEVMGYLDGNYDYDMMVKIMKKNTRNFAKRQLTWFRRYEDAIWINLDKDSYEKNYKKIVNLL